MNTLRWILGSATVLLTLGFWSLLLIGDGFRRSFGASENSGWKVAVAVVIQIALVGSIAFPTHRAMMHASAAVILAVAVSCLWVLRESAFVGTSSLAFCALWTAYYLKATGILR